MRSRWLLLLVVIFAASSVRAESYPKKVERELDRLGTKVESLRAQSQHAGEKTRNVLDKDTRVLQEKLEQARRSLNEMVSNGTENSKPIRRHLDDAVKEIRGLYRKAAAHFNEKS